jgi:hypothetical protein
MHKSLKEGKPHPSHMGAHTRCLYMGLSCSQPLPSTGEGELPNSMIRLLEDHVKAAPNSSGGAGCIVGAEVSGVSFIWVGC